MYLLSMYGVGVISFWLPTDLLTSKETKFQTANCTNRDVDLGDPSSSATHSFATKRYSLEWNEMVELGWIQAIFLFLEIG